MIIASLLDAEKKTSSGLYLDNVTGLRGLAVLWVLLFHLWGISGGPRLTVDLAGLSIGLTGVARMGHMGVDIFFVLSGFLLTLALVQPPRDRPFWPAVGAFYQRRLLRIVPAYYAVVLAMVVLALFGFTALPSVPNVLAHAFFLHEALGFPPLRAVFWTLPVEVSFYLLLPFIVWRLDARRCAWFLAAAVLFAFAFRFGLFQLYHKSQFNNMRFLYTLAGSFDQFAMGIACAFAFKWRRAAPGKANILTLVGLAGLLLTANFFARRGDLVALADPAFFAMQPLAGFFIALMLYGAASGGRVAGFLFGNTGMVFIGTISYSIYLWHTVILDALAKSGLLGGLGGATRFGAAALYTLAPILLVSLASYAWTERPFLKIRHGSATRPAGFMARHPLAALLLAAVGLVAVAALAQGLRAAGIGPA